MVVFDINCRRCVRLAEYRDQMVQQHPDYHNAPVAAFGVQQPKLLIIGLAPGMHGANRTGRPFTGDAAGKLLYKMLYRFGFSNQPHAERIGDGLALIDCRITNAVKCVPPKNKPMGAEIKECNQFLKAELQALAAGTVILALGHIAHQAIIQAYKVKPKDYAFSHNRKFNLKGIWLLDSYHCSQYNTNTGRLTEVMFASVFENAKALLSGTCINV